MKKFATHTTLLALSASLLLLVSRAPLADEPVDAADEVAPAITDEAEAAAAAESAGEDAPADPVEEIALLEQRAAAGAAGAPRTGSPPEELTTESRAPGTEAAAEAEPALAGAAPGPDTATGDEAAAQAMPEAAPEAAGKLADAAPVAIDTLDGDSEAGEQAPPAVPDAGVADSPQPAAPLDETPATRLDGAATVADEATSRTLTMLKADVLPGSYQRLSWSATEMFEDLPVATPVLVVNGRLPGPTLCLTAAVHGDELNGIEMVRRVMHDLNPKTLSGAVIGVPIVNLQGFRRGSRYLPDRRDLNRYFPGNPRGSAAARIAHSFFTEVIEHCDALVDLHTGSFDRANLPQLRADLRHPDVITLTHGFGATVILHSEPADGTLRYAATRAGIPTVTLEAGGPSELELKEVMHGVKGIETLLNTLGMVDKVRLWADQQPVYYRSSWVRANRGGILLADVSLGSTVRRGDLLGTITDPMNNASTNLYSPYSGRVIGMARNQVVMPGFAAFHVGIQAVDANAVEAEPEPRSAEPGDEQDDETLAREGAEAGEGDYVDGMSE